MSDLEVTYFDYPGGRGEEVRLALNIAGVDFDDNRLSFDAFGKIKPDLQFGSLPILKVNNSFVLAQTNAILRLIGRQYGLHPDDPFEAARHDAFMEAVEELRQRIAPTLRMNDAAEKKAAREELSAIYIPHWGLCVERLIGSGPFVGGDVPSVADIKLYMVENWISSGGVDDIPNDIFDPFTKFKALADGIRNHPAVLKWYTPKTQSTD